jgi:hypothetical protein
MSGRKYKKPDDIIKARQEYIDNLNMEIYLQEQVEKAVRQYKETGQLPPISQIKDNRTVEDKFKDLLGLKQSIVKELLPIADIQLATSIVNRLSSSPLNVDNRLIYFLAQRVPDLVQNLKKLYKYGISATEDDAEQFINLIYKYYNDNNNLTSTTKQFLSRLGTTSTTQTSQKINTQSQSLSRLGAEISSLVRLLFHNIDDMVSNFVELLEEIEYVPEDAYGYDEEEDIDEIQEQIYERSNELISKIEDTNQSIITLITNLNVIFPNNPNFFEQIEKLLIYLEGNQIYDELSTLVSTYLKYINDNIPNLDFLGGLMLSLKKSYERAINLSNNRKLYTTTLDIELTKFNDILTSIYNQLNTGEGPKELEKIRRIYEDLIRYINYYGVEGEEFLKPKKIGEPAEQYIPPLEQPEIPADFGKQQRNYIEIDDWPPNLMRDYLGLQKYKNEYVQPLINIVSDEGKKEDFNRQAESLLEDEDIDGMVELKAEIKQYLIKNRINYKKIKPPLDAIFGVEPERTTEGFTKPKQGKYDFFRSDDEDEGYDEGDDEDEGDDFYEYPEVNPLSTVTAVTNPYFRHTLRREEGAEEAKGAEEGEVSGTEEQYASLTPQQRTQFNKFLTDLGLVNNKENRRAFIDIFFSEAPPLTFPRELTAPRQASKPTRKPIEIDLSQSTPLFEREREMIGKVPIEREMIGKVPIKRKPAIKDKDREPLLLYTPSPTKKQQILNPRAPKFEPKKEVKGTPSYDKKYSTRLEKMKKDPRLRNPALYSKLERQIKSKEINTRQAFNELGNFYYEIYDREAETSGFGIGRMKGRGFNKSLVEPTQGPQQDPRYIKFGKFLINTKKLKDDILSLRREKGTPIQNLPVYKMSRPFANVIKKIIGNGIPDDNDYLDLTDDEKRYLHKVSKASDLNNKIKIPTPSKDEDEKDLHLFNVYKGEIMAGNDSKELINKFKLLLNKLGKKNILNKKEVDDLIDLLP